MQAGMFRKISQNARAETFPVMSCLDKLARFMLVQIWQKVSCS